jgi:hypothetical protein
MYGNLISVELIKKWQKPKSRICLIYVEEWFLMEEKALKMEKYGPNGGQDQ